MAEEQLNLIQKLAQIRQMCNVVSKSRKGYNYRYADITDILAKVTAGMKKYNVSLIPSVVPGTVNVQQNVITNTKMDKTGKAFDNTVTEMLVNAEMVFTWVNDDDPKDILEVPWVIVGSQGDPSQAFGSSLTYCTRYFLTNFFSIAQPETDVDSYRSKQKEAEVAEDVALAKELIGQLDEAVRDYLEKNKDKQASVKKFLEKYVKGGDYFKIKDPALAADALNTFKNTYKN